MTTLGSLRGARVRRVDGPSEQLLALSLGAGALRVTLLLGLGPQARGLGLCETRPPGSVRGPFVLQLRSAIEGARFVEVRELGEGALYLGFERGPLRSALVIGPGRARAQAGLWNESGELTAALPDLAQVAQLELLYQAVEHAPVLDDSLDDLRMSGKRLLESQAGALLSHRKTEVGSALARAITRLQRRLTAVQADLAREAEVETLRRNGGLLLSNLHAIARGQHEVSLLDPSTDPPLEVALRIDPQLGPKQQAEAWFKRARRLERGAKVSSERAASTEAELAAVQALAANLQAAADLDAIEVVAAAASSHGVEVSAAQEPAAKPQKAARVPYREFSGTGSRAILVGKGAADNDELTLHHAKPHDLWLHARDDSGAHVVVPLSREEACPPELLCDAATLAAHFSGARGQNVVDITYVARRYVRKPRKSPAGLVTLEREKVFRLRLEPARLQRLLASERGRLG